MFIDLSNKYIECGHLNSTRREECQNVNLCRGEGIRERTERVEGMCQRCLEALQRMYRMNKLDFTTRGDNIVEGEQSLKGKSGDFKSSVRRQSLEKLGNPRTKAVLDIKT
jgi:hypothetical protein